MRGWVGEKKERFVEYFANKELKLAPTG